MLRRNFVHHKYIKIFQQFNRNVYKWRTFEEIISPTYLIIPDVPTVNRDYPLINPRTLPNFTSLSPDEMVRGMSVVTQEYESKLDELTAEIESEETPIDFDYIINRIERFSYPVECADNWCYLNFILNSSLMHQLACSATQKKSRVTKMERWSNKPLKKVIDALVENQDTLTEFDRGVLSMYQRQFKVNGINLSPQVGMGVLKAYTHIDKTAETFRVLVHATAKKFKQLVDAGCMPEAPREFLDSITLKDGVSSRASSSEVCDITLNPGVYHNFMKYCADRSLRRNAWDAWVRRAGQSMHSVDNLTNHNNIPELRRKRRDISGALGFKNHAEMKISGHMAGKVEPVVEMLDLYRLKYWDQAEEEMGNLVELASTEQYGLGFEPPLKPWDVPYYTRKYELLNPLFDGSRVRQFFPLESVLKNSFGLCRDWFNIEIVQAPVPDKEKFHADVTYYQVKDLGAGGNVIAGFFLDPYKRPSKMNVAAMLPLNNRSEVYGCDPTAYFLLNLEHKADGRTLLSPDDVGDFMHCLGNGLQHMLTRVDHAEVAGRSNLPPDAFHICGAVFRRLSRCPVVLRALSSHYETGEAMPEDLVEAVAKARPHTGAMRLLEEMYLSAFDLEIWMTSEFWRDVQSKLWQEFMVVPEVKGDEWPSSFTPIFCDGRDATIYSNLWTNTVAVDIINAFEEINLDLSSNSISPVDMKPVMDRFRSTFLSLGGAVPAAEVFRRFRGRDPVRTVDLL